MFLELLQKTVNIIFAYLEHNTKTGFFEIDYNDSIKLTQKILDKSEGDISDGHPSVSPDNRWIVYPWEND